MGTPKYLVALAQALSRRHAPAELAELLYRALGFRAQFVGRAVQVQFVEVLLGPHPGAPVVEDRLGAVDQQKHRSPVLAGAALAAVLVVARFVVE